MGAVYTVLPWGICHRIIIWHFQKFLYVFFLIRWTERCTGLVRFWNHCIRISDSFKARVYMWICKEKIINFTEQYVFWLLKHFIYEEEIFTLELLNKTVSSFNCGYGEKKRQVSILTANLWQCRWDGFLVGC